MKTNRSNETVTGTREELAAELEDRAEGWHHMGGSQRKIDRALEAAQALRSGTDSVQVGHATYAVAASPETAVPEPRDENADTGVSQP